MDRLPARVDQLSADGLPRPADQGIQAGGDELTAAAAAEGRAGAVDDDGILKFQLTILTSLIWAEAPGAGPQRPEWYLIPALLRITNTTDPEDEAGGGRSR